MVWRSSALRVYAMILLSFVIGFVFFESVHQDITPTVSPQDAQMTMATAARLTKWKGISSSWSEPVNWDNGIPSESTDVIISVGSSTGKADPVVPPPLNDVSAAVRNLTIQSGAKLTFSSSPNPGVLVVHGSEKLQNDGYIVLGSGTVIFKSKITFMQGGTFDAGSGTLQFEGVTWENKSGSVFNPGTSSVILSGSGDQAVTGNIQFYNLRVACAGTVTLSGYITVTNQLVIEEGSTLDVPQGSTLNVEGSFQNNGEVSGTGTVLVQGQPLPVQLSSFTADASATGVELRWRTESETNNYGFEIQRRAIGQELSGHDFWQAVGFVQGSGTSTSPKEYVFYDGSLSAGRYAYRIKQIDSDGSFKIYHSVEVEVGTVARELVLLQNYPNPFNPSTQIGFSVERDGLAVLRIYDVAGREVGVLFNDFARAGRLYQVSFDARNLSTGVYFSVLESYNQRVVRKMAVVK